MKSFFLYALLIVFTVFTISGATLAQENLKVAPQKDVKISSQKKVDVAEKAKVIKKVKVSKLETASFSYVCLPHKGDYKDHEMVIGKFMGAIQTHGITPEGPLLGIYYNSPHETKPEDLVWEIGFQVAGITKIKKPLVLKKWEFTKVAKAMHLGPYEKVSEIYPAIFKWIAENKLAPVGPSMERFLNDPANVKPEEIKTEIWLPVKEIPAKKEVKKETKE